jgi:hypothetical protein
MILDTFITQLQNKNKETEEEIPTIEFCKRLFNWAFHGYNELGDTTGEYGLGKQTGTIVKNENFLKNPHEVSQKIWENTGKILVI